MQDDWIGVKGAASWIDVSPETVRRMCIDGQIGGAYRVGSGRGQWRIPIIEVTRFIQSRHSTPAPLVDIDSLGEDLADLAVALRANRARTVLPEPVAVETVGYLITLLERGAQGVPTHASDLRYWLRLIGLLKARHLEVFGADDHAEIRARLVDTLGRWLDRLPDGRRGAPRPQQPDQPPG